MKNLGNLSPAKGSNRPKKRVGRGIGSGKGKTSGKGHKGQKARTGGGVAPGFEGGQMPIYRRLPKRGFKNPFRTDYNVVNVESLEKIFEAGATVDVAGLKEKGLLRYPNKPVKLLARGTIEKAFTEP